jgi:hypothetical protein
LQGSPFEQRSGEVFEKFALASIHRPKNTQRFPGPRRRGSPPPQVIPDAVADLEKTLIVDGQRTISIYENSIFIDAKQAGTLKYSSDNRQLAAMIDYLATSSVAALRQRGLPAPTVSLPALNLMTTSDTKLDIAFEALSFIKGVTLNHSILLSDDNRAASTGTYLPYLKFSAFKRITPASILSGDAPPLRVYGPGTLKMGQDYVFPFPFPRFGQ